MLHRQVAATGQIPGQAPKCHTPLKASSGFLQVAANLFVILFTSLSASVSALNQVFKKGGPSEMETCLYEAGRANRNMGAFP